MQKIFHDKQIQKTGFKINNKICEVLSDNFWVSDKFLHKTRRRYIAFQVNVKYGFPRSTKSYAHFPQSYPQRFSPLFSTAATIYVKI